MWRSRRAELVHNAYLGLGGNLGDRLYNLQAAVRRLDGLPAVRVVAASSLYESKPLGPAAQPDYLNAVLLVATSLSPHELLAECMRVETGLGRVRSERWGARTVDLDVLLYDDLQLAGVELTVPHPRMLERSFVLTPLAEIAPHVILAGASIQDHATKLGPIGLRRVAGPEWAVNSMETPRDADSRR